MRPVPRYEVAEWLATLAGCVIMDGLYNAPFIFNMVVALAPCVYTLERTTSAQSFYGMEALKVKPYFPIVKPTPFPS